MGPLAISSQLLLPSGSAVHQRLSFRAGTGVARPQGSRRRGVDEAEMEVKERQCCEQEEERDLFADR